MRISGWAAREWCELVGVSGCLTNQSPDAASELDGKASVEPVRTCVYFSINFMSNPPCGRLDVKICPIRLTDEIVVKISRELPYKKIHVTF